jgi:hypothetical protein
MAEGKTTNEYGDTREDGIEEIESPYCTNTDEVEQRALYAKVSERLMQALEDSICPMRLMLLFWHKSLIQMWVEAGV